MGGLNLVTGTGRQTIDEIKRKLGNVDIDDINEQLDGLSQEVTTNKEDIEHLNQDIVDLDGKIASAGSADWKRLQVTTAGTNVVINPGDDVVWSEFITPLIKCDATAEAVTHGSSTKKKACNAEGVETASYYPFYLILPAGTTRFRLHFKSDKGVKKVITYVYEDDSTFEVKEIKETVWTGVTSGNFNTFMTNMYYKGELTLITGLSNVSTDFSGSTQFGMYR